MPQKCITAHQKCKGHFEHGIYLKDKVSPLKLSWRAEIHTKNCQGVRAMAVGVVRDFVLLLFTHLICTNVHTSHRAGKCVGIEKLKAPATGDPNGFPFFTKEGSQSVNFLGPHYYADYEVGDAHPLTSGCMVWGLEDVSKEVTFSR